MQKVVEAETNKREEALYQCALDVETDQALNDEMAKWEGTVGDGIESEVSS